MVRVFLELSLPIVPNFVHAQLYFPCRRRGDRDNVLFGGFYRLDVPLYDGMGSTSRWVLVLLSLPKDTK